MVVIAATAISIPAVAGAAAKKHKPKAHSFTASTTLVNVNPPGPIAGSGTQTAAGLVDGTIGGVAVHGALRGTQTYSGANFTGTATVFVPAGSVTFTETGSGTGGANGAIVFSGTGTITKGTGAYKGAKGTLTFNGTIPGTKDADGDSDVAVATFNAKGTLKY
jgi:hypothetical protein